MAAPPGGGRTPGAARPATFASARLLLISGAAQVSDGVHEELLSRHQGAPTALSQVRALLEAGPSGAIENVEDELGLPRGLPGKLSVVALNHRDKVGIHTCAVFCESPCIGSHVGPARDPARAKAVPSARGVGRSIPSPAGGLRAASLSCIGLPGLDLRYAALSNHAFLPLERGLLRLLRASMLPSRVLPQPPPQP